MKTLPQKKFFFQQSGSCHHCQSAFGSNIKVMNIEADSNYGWQLSGKGLVQAECHCPICGMMYTAAEKMIPIECGSYLCPNCKGAEYLEYKVCKIERVEGDFTFKAEISCKKCNRKNYLSSVLKRIFNIKKLEIKTTGVTIERFGE